MFGDWPGGDCSLLTMAHGRPMGGASPIHRRPTAVSGGCGWDGWLAWISAGIEERWLVAARMHVPCGLVMRVTVACEMIVRQMAGLRLCVALRVLMMRCEMMVLPCSKHWIW